jgi:hypothetical protein
LAANPSAAEEPEFALAGGRGAFNGKIRPSARQLFSFWFYLAGTLSYKNPELHTNNMLLSFETSALYTCPMREGPEFGRFAAVRAEDAARQILQLFEDGDRALIAANVGELRRIYADDYLQYDERGRTTTKEELIDNLTSGRLRFVSMRSTGRGVPILNENCAVVHGSEENVIEQDGQRRRVCYVYTDVVMKRAANWQIVASQLAKSNETS